MSEYRHEDKYVINYVQKEILLLKLSGLLELDIHARNTRGYSIHSLYFDDSNNTCYFENEDGVDNRAKFRMRYYNDDTSKISLEKKVKMHGMTKKISCLLEQSECRELLSGRIPIIQEGMDEVKKMLFTQMRIRGMVPKIIVSYDRIPYVCSVGNVRITIDQNIASSDDLADFLNARFRKRPILDTGKSILEVKWDEIMPEFIMNSLQMKELQWTSFSKYYYARKFSMCGGIY